MTLASASPIDNMPATGAPLANEWSVLLAACSLTPPCEKRERLTLLLQQPINWNRLFSLAEQHGVQPLLYLSLAEISASDSTLIPSDERRSLQESNTWNVRKALLLSRELIRVVDHLNLAQIPAIPYKGIALAESIYGDIALRQAGDIDLLIHPQDFSRAREALRALSFTPHAAFPAKHEREYLNSGYECSFDAPAGPNLLELQWAIQPRFYAIDFDMAGLFDRSVGVTVAGHSMKALSTEDLFLVLAAHAAKHVWGRLIWLCDLARIQTQSNLDWQWIAARSKESGMCRILQISLHAANQLLEAEIPAGALKAGLGQSDPCVSTVVDELQIHCDREDMYNVESIAYFRLMMRLRERSSDRIRFLQRLIFTPGPGEWDAVRLPGVLYPLYRIVRLSRLAARLLRQ